MKLFVLLTQHLDDRFPRANFTIHAPGRLPVQELPQVEFRQRGLTILTISVMVIDLFLPLRVDPTRRIGLPQFDANHGVQNRYDQHRDNEEAECGRSKSILQWVLDGTLSCVHDQSTFELFDHDPELDGHWNGTESTNNPNGENQLDHSGQFGHGVCPDRMADGEVSLHGKTSDGQDGSVG